MMRACDKKNMRFSGNAKIAPLVIARNIETKQSRGISIRDRHSLVMDDVAAQPRSDIFHKYKSETSYEYPNIH